MEPKYNDLLEILTKQLEIAKAGLLRCKTRDHIGAICRTPEFVDSVLKEIEEANPTGFVIIPRDTWIELNEDSRKLNALDLCGVDNWEGYDDAMEYLENME